MLKGHTTYVLTVAFSPDGSTLASASWDMMVRLWNPETMRPKSGLIGHTGYVLSVAYSPDGQTLASGSTDGTVLLWDMTRFQPKSD